jgi:hypothetical protein
MKIQRERKSRESAACSIFFKITYLPKLTIDYLGPLARKGRKINPAIRHLFTCFEKPNCVAGFVPFMSPTGTVPTVVA